MACQAVLDTTVAEFHELGIEATGWVAIPEADGFGDRRAPVRIQTNRTKARSGCGAMSCASVRPRDS